MTARNPARPVVGAHNTPAHKHFRRGTHRLVEPAETLARMQRFMPVMGITRIANVTGLDHIGVPVVMVPRPNSRCLAVAQGKGIDLNAARVSGLMESVETYHAERITLPLKLCSYEELRYTHRVVAPQALPRPRHALFDVERPLLWIEGHDLLGDESVWIPYDLVHTNYTVTHLREPHTFLASSNGLASGNHPLEAISHAICEVVERDAATLWLLLDEEARGATRIAVDSVDDEACRTVLERFDRAGVDASLWDMTSDIGIPAFWCTIVERSDRPMHRLVPATGTGCHPTRSIALLRALTEAAQSRLTVIAGSRDDLDPGQYDGQRRTHGPRDGDVASPRHFAGATLDVDTFDDEVAWELSCVRAAGIERVVIVDLTKPEFRIPVVRVVIPGLEPLDRHDRFARGTRAMRKMAGQA